MKILEEQRSATKSPLDKAKYDWALWSGVLLFCAGVASICAALWLIVAGYSSTPYSDQWAPLTDLASGRRFTSLSWLWQQHNEHRILLYRLSLFIDLKFLGGRSILQFGLIFCCLSANWVLWITFFKKALFLPQAVWLTLSGFFAFCVFCPSQYENLYWAFQWTFVGEFLFSSASFISLAWFCQTQRPWLAVAGASSAAFLSEACLANGIVTWLILWISCHFLPLQRKHRALLYLLGVVAIFLYLRGYRQPTGHSNPFDTLHKPVQVAQYVLTYFGLGMSKYVTFPAFAVVAVSLAGVASVFRLLRSRETQLVGIVLTMSLSFQLATAVITALGRLKFGLVQAQASRYQTGAMLYWGCIFAGLTIVAYLSRSWRHITALNIFGLCIILLPASSFFQFKDTLHSRAEALSSMGQALDQGSLDPLAYAVLGMPNPQTVYPIERGSEYLHSTQHEVGPEPILISDRLAAQAISSKVACLGSLDSLAGIRRFTPGLPVVRIDGWSMFLPKYKGAKLFAVSDQFGHVLAASSIVVSRPDVLTAYPDSSGDLGWRLYVPLKAGTNELHVLAFDDNQKCTVGTYVFHTIVNKGSGKILESASQTDADPTVVRQAQQKIGEKQEWEFLPVDAHNYQLISVATGNVLDVIGQSTADGAGIQQFRYVGGDNQKWSFAPAGGGYLQILNKGSGKVLGVIGQSKQDQAQLQQNSYIGSDSQKWKITPPIQ